MLKRLLIALIAALAVFGGVAAQDDAPPPADIINDEGGPVRVVGELNYTNLFFLTGTAQPIVILEDQAGFVMRDLEFVIPPESQVLGNFTTDFFGEPPIGYSISLPIEPAGTLMDVDNDDDEDTGVMIYTPAYWTNIFGSPFLDLRDGGRGWSGSFASTIVDPATAEVEGGDYIIYAPEEGQGFPSGFGEDGMLFTEDDPIVTVPTGYTIVNMDTDVFTFDRSRVAELDLIESEGSELDDFSDLSYTEAFDEMVALLRLEYAYTELRGMDWDLLVEAFRPRFEEAEANDDFDAYVLALRDFSWQIPDGHINAQGTDFTTEQFLEATDGGLGLALAELDDGRIIVSFLTPEGPAELARIELGDEILAINGVEINEYVTSTVPFSLPLGTETNLRLQQLRYATRFPLGDTVEITYSNPELGQPQTVELATIDERDSFAFTSFARGFDQVAPPVTFEILPTGYAHVKINTFFGNEVLTIQQWEYMIETVKLFELPGIILDLRQNGGGSGFLADQMAAYFFDETVNTGTGSAYDPDIGDFFQLEGANSLMYPPSERFRYDGPVAVLVGPFCSSACEFFSWNMTLEDRATIIGQYPSAGLGGGITDFVMPEGLRFRYTRTRQLDPDGNIHIEGIGALPTLRVPVTEETVFSQGDPVLEAAVDFLNGDIEENNPDWSDNLLLASELPNYIGDPAEAPQVDEAEIIEEAMDATEADITDEAVAEDDTEAMADMTEMMGIQPGESIAGELDPEETVTFKLTGEAGVVDITLEADFPTLLRLYDESGDVLLFETETGEVLGIPLGADTVLMLEVVNDSDDEDGDYTLTVSEGE